MRQFISIDQLFDHFVSRRTPAGKVVFPASSYVSARTAISTQRTVQLFALSVFMSYRLLSWHFKATSIFCLGDRALSVSLNHVCGTLSCLTFADLNLLYSYSIKLYKRLV